MSGDTYWNGEPANCARGWGRIAHDMPAIGKWDGAHTGDRIRVVRVFYGGESFDLFDQDDRAWNKVTSGRGSPRFGHRNVRLLPYSLEPDDWGVLGDEYFRREGIATPTTAAPVGDQPTEQAKQGQSVDPTAWNIRSNAASSTPETTP